MIEHRGGLLKHPVCRPVPAATARAELAPLPRDLTAADNAIRSNPWRSPLPSLFASRVPTVARHAVKRCPSCSDHLPFRQPQGRRASNR